MTEACVRLPHPTQRQRLHALQRGLNIEPVPPIQDSAYWADVFQWLAKYADHQPDWADACLAVLSGHDTQMRLWTYDSEFRTTWRRPDGTRIPLAVK